MVIKVMSDTWNNGLLCCVVCVGPRRKLLILILSIVLLLFMLHARDHFHLNLKCFFSNPKGLARFLLCLLKN